jgi:signal peptidase II
MRSLKNTLRNLALVLMVIMNIGCDQISKTVVRKSIDYNEEVALIGNYFTLTKVENEGAFLSLGNSWPSPLKFFLLSLLPFIALLTGLYFVLTKTNTSKYFALGICCVIGGGIGNLYDRVVYGSVTDFLYIDFIIFHTGIFNLADVSIMAGIFIILIYTFFKKKDLEFQK